MRFGLNLPPHFRVFGAFFIYSFCLGGIYPRIGDIQTALQIEEGTLGLALIGMSVGTLISLTFASSILEKVGYRRAILALIPALSVLFAIAVLALNPLALFILFLPVGMTIGAIEIIINLEADRVEHQLGYRIMNRAHAFWSFGFFASGITGGLISQAGISPQAHLAFMVPIVVLGTALLLGKFEPAAHRASTSTEPAPRFARPTFAIMILVLVTLSAMLLEGGGADWSAIYMRDVFAATPFIAGLAVAAGPLLQAITRFFADAFVERFSPTNVARVLLSVQGIGGLLVFFASSVPMALAGFAVIGIGTSAMFPLAMSAAAQRNDRAAVINVAALAQTSFVAFLLGPPLLGFVAEHFGVRWSFGLALPLVIVSFALAGALGRKPLPHAVGND
jgi:MFS family permease